MHEKERGEKQPRKRAAKEKGMITIYIKNTNWYRVLLMFAGNVFLSMGVAIFKLSSLGNDPFNGMVMGLSDCFGMAYANFLVIINLLIFAVEIIFGRHLIGWGTIVNAFINGYMATFFYNAFSAAIPATQMWQRVLCVLIGVVVCSFGLSMYQGSDVGVAPYDALSLIMNKRLHIPYFWCRMSNDVVCALICFFSGGIIGLGTIVCAFGLGPVIHFFDDHFTNKILQKPIFAKK